MKTEALEELKELLPEIIDNLINNIERKAAFALYYPNESDKTEIENEIKYCYIEFLYDFEQMPYKIEQEYRHNYSKYGKDAAFEYIKQIECFFESEIKDLNNSILDLYPRFPLLLDECKQKANQYGVILHHKSNADTLIEHCLQVNGMYLYLCLKLSIGVPAKENTKQDDIKPVNYNNDQPTRKQEAIILYFMDKAGKEDVPRGDKKQFIAKYKSTSLYHAWLEITNGKNIDEDNLKTAIEFMSDPSAKKEATEYLNKVQI